MPPTPVNWWLDPVPQNNTCTSPNPQLGCHNPRLDTNNITCDYTVTDPNDVNFCVPENVNIDFPPMGQWMRIGVNYYSNHGLNYDVHPLIKVFCDGALSAQLGPAGYYVPESPVTFNPSDGVPFFDRRFWVVADVGFTTSTCGVSTCTVKPVYSTPAERTPWFSIEDAETSVFAPAYPPGP